MFLMLKYVIAFSMIMFCILTIIYISHIKFIDYSEYYKISSGENKYTKNPIPFIKHLIKYKDHKKKVWFFLQKTILILLIIWIVLLVSSIFINIINDIAMYGSIRMRKI